MSTYKFITILTFKTTSEHIDIDDALLATFRDCKWSETNKRADFQSDSLSDALVDTYFANAERVKANMTHKFDVYSEHEVSLSVMSEVQPQFRQIDPYEALPNAQFVITNYSQDLSSDWCF